MTRLLDLMARPDDANLVGPLVLDEILGNGLLPSEASGLLGQLGFYLRRGLENGLTREQITEAMTHLAFYAGWAKATTAMHVTAITFEQSAPAAAQASSNVTGTVSVSHPFRGSGGSRHPILSGNFSS